MKTEKVTKNEFDVVITLTKQEVLDLLPHLRKYSDICKVSVPVIDGLINNLRQYEIPSKEEREEELDEKTINMRFTYRNIKGESSWRNINVLSVEEYKDDLKIVGFDVDKDALRTFLFSRFVAHAKVEFRVEGSIIVANPFSGNRCIFLSYLTQAQNRANRTVYKL